MKAETAFRGGRQSITIPAFQAMMRKLGVIGEAIGKRI
jgi:hypothetical protein